MKTKSFFAVLSLVLCSVSCIDFSNNVKKDKLTDDDFIAVVTNEEYEVKLPKYMKEATGLNDEASLQYQNVFKETYFVVIDEYTDDFVSVFKDLGEYDESISVVKNYKNIQLQYFQESLTAYDFLEEKSLEINGLDSEMTYFDGKIEGVIYPINYCLAFIEGDEKVYMLMAWTLKDRKDKYRETFDKIVKSFRLVDNQTASK
ncbi:hypothetical protein [Allomuricauda sp. d1]|uniref:hypothetical protein n=1 Tax=Allomuricauda sp. d1 TaxID=3136725 RepID=UPI0031E19C6F